MENLTLQKTTPSQMMNTPRKGKVMDAAPDVQGLNFTIVNVYLVGAPGSPDRSWTLVDAGVPTSHDEIVAAAERRVGAGSRPAAILRPHGHFDHVGSLKRLAERWDAPVYAHSLELPYLTGRSEYPPPDPTVGGGTMATVASRTFPRKPIDLGARVQALPADGGVPGMDGWRWIHTPGHAPGHVSFFREADRVLIVGDAFVTVRQESTSAVLRQKAEVWRPPAYFTPDWISAKSSVQELASLLPSVAATGHGIIMQGEELRSGLETLAREFDRFVPERGRYVRQPARMDEQGIVTVPPKGRDPLPMFLAGLGATALLGAALRGRRKRDGQAKGEPVTFRPRR